ncbi:LOW QUALITY PROTEIN: amino acid transporter heavy chain SLC3A2 [Haemorhous mexicanus]|uniref:LOW QUALITY PROTEIN: amino acid transporter heavy chain SLC3A2 n=1 Tax=Haemorhous mexicanus TaxID=30427 RepID=UPI0028BF49CA|nr:LOW QUALITY PROTEIN: amino acid transporter heavy chain SLC3A2 [Haemorhous mexicanus]
MDPESPPRELELSALEAEKEPMAAAEAEPGTPPEAPPPHRDPSPAPEQRQGGEKNGLVMKIPPEEEEEAALGGTGVSGSPKFTGLGKEELLREAGTPLWARARLVLLVLFWAGWLGMLGAAAAIVAQAPRCQPLPAKAWWELGALYRAPPKAFGGNLEGVVKHLGYLKEKLQVGGLVLGPVAPQKSPEELIPPLRELDPALGTSEDFSTLLQAAKDKGACPVFRVLVGGTRLQEPWLLPQVPGGLQLLLGPFLQPLEPRGSSESPSGALRNLLNFLSSSNSSVGLGWSVGSPWEAWVSPELRLQQLLLLWGLPGTPVLSYGDELGLQRPLRNQQLPSMPWEWIEEPKTGGNGSEPPELELCTALASLRAHERSLLLGEARAVPAGPAMALLRRWDQSQRFLLLLNPQDSTLRPFSDKRDPGDPQEPPLPASATLHYSTGPKALGEQQVQLQELQVGPYQGLLLGFPYSPQ